MRYKSACVFARDDGAMSSCGIEMLWQLSVWIFESDERHVNNLVRVVDR